jgi:hypothetical protein
MRFRLRHHHSGGFLVSATNQPCGQPAYCIIYHPEHLRHVEVRRIIRNELRSQLQARH